MRWFASGHKALALLFIIFFYRGNAQQGKLLVIGGGGEKLTETSWERLPYQWAVDQSSNRKVAFVSFYEQSNVLPDFFMEELDAAYARNFLINNKGVADAQATYDSLVQYDVIFLKGGDQYNYYSTYKNTLTEQAIIDKYNEGGVICGTSAGLAVLGGVDYVAAQASADPHDALQDPLNSDITLEDDFLPFVPGVIFDSHFAERGRFGRLVGFLANWQIEHNETLTGIGIDDMTAIAFDTHDHFTVYGTGAANIYRATSGATFSGSTGFLTADSVEVIQLLHLDGYTLSTGQVNSSLEAMEYASPRSAAESVIYLSGGNQLSDNADLLEAFAGEVSGNDPNVLLLTRSVNSQAAPFAEMLSENVPVETIGISLALINDAALGESIRNTNHFLFCDLNAAEFYAFLENGDNGPLLLDKLKQPGTVAAFTGSSAALAGSMYVENANDPGAAYEGRLSFNEGLSLLPSGVIMPETYANSDIYENTSTAVPYLMAREGLRYGIWLTGGNYLKYHTENEQMWLTGYGNTPVMVQVNRSDVSGVSDQTSYGDGNDAPRMVAGFDRMMLSVLQPGRPFSPGKIITSRSTRQANQERKPYTIQTFQGGEKLHLLAENPLIISVFDTSGRLRTKEIMQPGTKEYASDFQGLHILCIFDVLTGREYLEKIVLN